MHDFGNFTFLLLEMVGTEPWLVWLSLLPVRAQAQVAGTSPRRVQVEGSSLMFLSPCSFPFSLKSVKDILKKERKKWEEWKFSCVISP